MKVMQNNAFRVEANENKTIYRNVTFCNTQGGYCACSKCKGLDCFNKQFGCGLPDTFCKVEEDAGYEIPLSHNLNRINSLTRNAKRLLTVDSSNAKINHSAGQSHHDTPYVNVSSEVIQGYVDVDHLSLYIRRVKESNSDYKNINDLRMDIKSEFRDSCPKFDNQKMFTKKQLYRFHDKEITPNLVSPQNIDGSIYAKNEYSNLARNDDPQLSSRMECHSAIQDASFESSNSLANDQEYKITHSVRNNRCNDLNSRMMLERKPSDSDIHSNVVVNGLLVPKDEANIHCSSDSVSSFDEASQITKARMQLLPFSGAKLNLCDICKKSFSTKGNLHNHHTVHSGQKPHECSVCKKTFSQRSTLGKHYLIHTGEKPHICNVCGRGFRQANNLRIHLLTHSGEKPHRCSVCDKGFTQKIALQKHMLTHTGVKPHACNVCKRCFTTKGNLQKHFLTHTGEKPHVCGICNRGFSQKIALKKHYLTHTGEKPFGCEVCGKRFTTKGNLKSHFKRHTRDKLSAATSSSVSRLATVPKSIADSILMPIPSEVSQSQISCHSSPPSTKSTLSAFSSQIHHPLLPKNHSIESSMSSFIHSAVPERNQALPYQFRQSEHQPLPSYMMPSVPYSQSSKLSSSPASFPAFPSQTSSSPSFPSSQDNQMMMSEGNSIPKPMVGPYSPPLAHSQVKTTLPQHVKPSDHLLSLVPRSYSSDSVSEYNTTAKSSSPLQGACYTMSANEGDIFVEKRDSPSQMDNTNVPSISLQNLQLHISSGLKEKMHDKAMTVL